MHKLPILLTLFLALGARSALAATRTVGPGRTYAKPCAAIAAAEPGDVIEVDANGNYAGDHCSWSTDNLTVRGVGGRAKIDGGKDPANIAAGKASSSSRHRTRPSRTSSSPARPPRATATAPASAIKA